MKEVCGIIELRGLLTSGVHGVYDSEQSDPQPFLVDVRIWSSLADAISSDEIAQTVDYAELTAQIRELVACTHFALIEKLAGEIASLCLANPRVVRADVTVHKPKAAETLGADDVAVTVQGGFRGVG